MTPPSEKLCIAEVEDRAIGSITRAEVRELLQSVRVSVIEEAEELARRARPKVAILLRPRTA